MKAFAASIHVPIAAALVLRSALAAGSQPAGNPPSHVPRGFVQVPRRSQFDRLPPNLRKRLRPAANPGLGAVQTDAETGHVPAEDVLYSFEDNAPKGDFPYGGLIRDENGTLYGTTSGGGTGYADAGVVYKVDPRGRESVLYSFTGGADGSGPVGSLLRGRAGELYGATQSGGARGGGVVYKVSPSGRETVLHNFQCYDPANGCQPHAGLIRDKAGNFYGTTFFGGGPLDAGVVFKLDPTGTFTVLHTFTCGAGEPSTCGADGGNPYDGVIRDSAGNLYGTTSAGGDASQGIAYKLDPAGNETVLHSFTGRADGGQPSSGLLDVDGYLYGTAPRGGNNGGGVIFKLPTQ